jgi:uncharacterized protein YfkK (UPF0435 family)
MKTDLLIDRKEMIFMIILTKKKLERINSKLHDRTKVIENDYNHFTDLLYESMKECGPRSERDDCNMVLNQLTGELIGIQYVINVINEIINEEA